MACLVMVCKPVLQDGRDWTSCSLQACAADTQAGLEDMEVVVFQVAC